MVKITFMFFLCWCLVTTSCEVDARLPRRKELNERHPHLINKPPIRSIQTKFGDIVDCVDINDQPAFDNPLLKNHKLQRKPSFLYERETTNQHTHFEFELEKDSCPMGSVPIRRTTEDELTQVKSSNLTYEMAKENPYNHYATLFTKQGDNRYKGVNGYINVYKPQVRKHQMSLAQISVQSGEVGSGRVNTIVSGWQVSRQLYHEAKHVHVFALWTSDSFNTTGCYNMLCPGFVQIDRQIYLGIAVSDVSSYGGQQYELSFSISQDLQSKNWWLIVQDIHVGYFPAELFSNLSVADLVGWGGRVFGVANGVSPPMGSGYFPDGKFNHACYIRNISYNNENGSLVEPSEKHLLRDYVDNPNCYDLKYYEFRDEETRYAFEFGGPGGNCTV